MELELSLGLLIYRLRRTCGEEEMHEGEPNSGGRRPAAAAVVLPGVLVHDVCWFWLGWNRDEVLNEMAPFIYRWSGWNTTRKGRRQGGDRSSMVTRLEVSVSSRGRQG